LRQGYFEQGFMAILWHAAAMALCVLIANPSNSPLVAVCASAAAGQ
jgi:hypothetical protein